MLNTYLSEAKALLSFLAFFGKDFLNSPLKADSGSEFFFMYFVK